MRKILSILLIVFCITLLGCDLDIDTQGLLVNNIGFGIGITAAKLPPEMDMGLRQIYNIAVTGQLDPDTTNLLVQSFVDSDDLVAKALADRLINLAQRLGATVIDGKITDLTGLDPKLLEELANGYVSGFNLASKAKG